MLHTMTLVVAAGFGGALGYQGNLPWPLLKRDMALFRQLTLGSTCLVGYKTYKSLPRIGMLGEKLPCRKLIILSDRRKQLDPPDGVLAVVNTVDEALLVTLANEDMPGSLVVIGGGATYAAAIRHAEKCKIPTKIFLNRIHTQVLSYDTKFPMLQADHWECLYRGPRFLDFAADPLSDYKVDTRLSIFSNIID